MAFDDKKLGTLFPTRHGTLIGTGPERVMLEATGGAGNIKKRFQNNLDGSVTMLQTRNGWPEFTTLGTTTVEALFPYLESGQLEWSFPGEANPTRLDAAAWHFLDLALGQDYLGYIKTDAAHLGNQKDDQVLTEGQDSLSVGATHSDASVLKKLVAGIFPASLFSGKMRRFIQAQYGAYETVSGFKLLPEAAGESFILQYVNNGVITLGLWAHDSPGIFTGSDGTWWLLRIRGGPEFQVLAYQLQLDSVGRRLREFYIQPTTAVFTEAVKSKLESYIFAHCTIDASNPSIIGGFTGAEGSPIAYGWKWNTDGTKASIVVHEVLGTGDHDLRWKASTMHLDIAYSAPSPASATGFSIESSIEVHGEWTDGWGTYNIFVPSLETSQSPMALFSLAVNTAGVKPKFSFGGIDVYGYYVDDAWEPVTISRNIAGPTGYTQNNNGQFAVPAQESATNNYYYSHDLASDSNHYNSKSITSGTEMTLSVGGASYQGTSETGVFIEYDFSNGGGGNFIGVAFATSQVTDTGVPFYGLPDGYATFDATGGVQAEWGYASRLYYEFTGTRHHAWVLVIASGDCEACYVATHTYDGAGSYIHEESTGRSITRFFSPVDSFVPFRGSFHFGGTFGLSIDRVDVSDTAAPPESTTYVYCFNTVIQAAQGVPGGSYYALFNVDYTYPYYDRGMYTYTSVDSRYVMSEGLKAPSSVMHNHRFVGWA